MKKYDKFLTIALFVIEVFYFYMIKQLPEKAARYPFFVLSILVVLTIILGIKSFLLNNKNSKEEDDGIFKNIEFVQFFEVIGISALYIFLIDIIGFFSITILYLLIIMLLLKSSLKWSIFTSIVFSIFLYLVFVGFLKVPIPRGFLI